MYKLLITLLILTGCSSSQIGSQSHDRTPASGSADNQLQEDYDTHVNIFSNIGSLNQWNKDLSSTVGFYSNADVSPVAALIARPENISIDIEIYEMTDPQVRAALRSALQQGVMVRIIKDASPVGETCHVLDVAPAKRSRKSAKVAAPKTPDSDCQDQISLVEEIRNAGGKVVAFNKTELCGNGASSGPCFEHGKMILIDKDTPEKAVALLSSGNFNSSNLCDLSGNPTACNRDYTYLTRDSDVIKALGQIFEADLIGTRYDDKLKSIINDEVVKSKITVSPYSFDPLKNFIQSAHSKVRIQNQYINDPELIKVIQELPKNIDVQVQLEDICNYGSIAAGPAAQYTEMFKSFKDTNHIQAKLFSRNHKIDGKPGYLHAKAIVVDDQKAWIGSVNGSASSLNNNREFGIFFDNPERVSQLVKVMDTDFQNPTNSDPLHSLTQCPIKAKSSKAQPEGD